MAIPFSDSPSTVTEPHQTLPRSPKSSKSTPDPSSLHQPANFRAPLRPFQDILARLTWDPSLPSLRTPQPSSIYIGYIDRHVGTLEKPLSAWQRDTTAEDFIPQHRVRYVVLRRRRRSGGDEVDLEKEAKAREDAEEMRGVVGRMEERIRETRSEEVRRELEAMVNGLKARQGCGFDEAGGENEGGEDKEIQEIVEDAIVLWHREERIDKIFGSGNSSGG